MKPFTHADREAAMHAALAAGDTTTATRYAAEIDAHPPAAPTPSLGAAALWYAEHGLAVFPLQPGTKIPMRGSSGCKDATLNPDRIRSWWAATPAANIGLATGGLVDVVDIDGLPGQTSRARLWFCDDHQTDRDPADGAPTCERCTFARVESLHVAKVLTPRAGGMHLYVPAQGDGNAAGIAPGVDYRGRGGYVVAPPSRTDVGVYRFLGTPQLDGLALDGRVAA